jgi:hypothetical protein
MGRVLYIVARERPGLRGYLMTRAGASVADGVEIKTDERRGDRRRSPEARDPDRRRAERRQHPSVDRDLRSRGYATVVQPEARAARTRGPAREPAMRWRPRSTWWGRAVRAGRRQLVRRPWIAWIVVLIPAVALMIVIARIIR